MLLPISFVFFHLLIVILDPRFCALASSFHVFHIQLDGQGFPETFARLWHLQKTVDLLFSQVLVWDPFPPILTWWRTVGLGLGGSVLWKLFLFITSDDTSQTESSIRKTTFKSKLSLTVLEFWYFMIIVRLEAFVLSEMIYLQN